MTYKMDFKGLSTILLMALFCIGISSSSDAASSLNISQSNNYEVETKKSNWFSNVKNNLKQNFRTAEKYVSKTYQKIRKQQQEANGFRKAGWGILMIIGGALVTLGSILTFSGWGFVIGIGLVIWGAIKVVSGILGAIFNAEI